MSYQKNNKINFFLHFFRQNVWIINNFGLVLFREKNRKNRLFVNS